MSRFAVNELVTGRARASGRPAMEYSSRLASLGRNNCRRLWHPPRKPTTRVCVHTRAHEKRHGIVSFFRTSCAPQSAEWRFDWMDGM